MREPWQFHVYGPAGCLIPLLLTLAVLIGIGAWTVVGWLF